MAIQSFASRVVEIFFTEDKLIKRVGWANAAKTAARKLDLLDYAEALSDLASPPGNRLEPLKGEPKGFHSIRINDQWRVSADRCRPRARGYQGLPLRNHHE